MSNLSADVTRKVLEAAMILFARHGFQRTSMGDLAREARIARATLYLRFGDKRAVFEALAAWRVAEALSQAEAAWRDEGTTAENIEATILAKDLPFFHLLTATPHGAELLGVDAALTSCHAATLASGFADLLTRRGASLQVEGADLDAFGGAEGFGRFLAIASAGLKHETWNEAEYRMAVRSLARVAACAARR